MAGAQQPPPPGAYDAEQAKTATESIKQILTLATAALTFSMTFWKELVKPAPGSTETIARWPLYTAWTSFLVAVLAGIMCLSVIAGFAQSKKGTSRSWFLRIPWIVEFLAFVIGIIAFFYYVVKAV